MFTTALEEGEIITSVSMPIPEASNYQKFEQPASRFALVGVFVAKYADGVRVAVTGASENGVFRWTEAEAALSANFSADALADLSVDAADMIADLHGSGSCVLREPRQSADASCCGCCELKRFFQKEMRGPAFAGLFLCQRVKRHCLSKDAQI